jgi:hypothetical protein
MRADIQLFSPYHSSLALNRGGFSEGSACHHFDPIRYIIRGASHPVISATVARPRRDQQEHAGCSTTNITTCKHTQLRDIVPRLTANHLLGGRVNDSNIPDHNTRPCNGQPSSKCRGPPNSGEFALLWVAWLTNFASSIV